MAPRAVLDTNVLISAYAFGRAPADLVRAAIRGEIEIATSPALLAELARVLADKLDFDQQHVEEVVKQVARVADVVRPRRRLAVLEDEPDNRVLECAQEAGASYVVTGDHHLLELGGFGGVQVISVAAAREVLANEGADGAVRALQSDSVKRALDVMPLAEIEAEIAAARRSRRRR